MAEQLRGRVKVSPRVSTSWRRCVSWCGTEYRKQVDEGMRKENVIG